MARDQAEFLAKALISGGALIMLAISTPPQKPGDTDNCNTKWLVDSLVSQAAVSRPDLKGYGTLPDLDVGMTLSPGLIFIAGAALPSLNTLLLASLREAVRPRERSAPKGCDDSDKLPVTDRKRC